MAFRGTESPMDFEWQGHGPTDASSPFHKIAMQNQRKRTHAMYDSPQKPSTPAAKESKSQPWFKNLPPAPSPSQYRTPSFTTPRKPVDFDFSSGPESSPAGPADDDDTPNGKPLPALPIEFVGNKTSTKRNSLFGLYGRFAPSPGRGEIKKPANDAVAKRIHKKRRKAHNFEKQLAIQRRSSEDSSDDDARPSSSDSKGGYSQKPKVQEIGWMTGFFTFIHAYPDAPSIIAKYLQVFFNGAILAGCLYMIWSFYATIRADVDRAGEEAKAEILAEMAACTKNYIENQCGAHTRLPALETICNNWELCMNRDTDSFRGADQPKNDVSPGWKRQTVHSTPVDKAIIFGYEIRKLRIFTVTFVLLGLFINNATFTLYRRTQEQHNMNGGHRYPSGPYMQPGANMNRFPTSPGQAYGQQYSVGWNSMPHELDAQQPQQQLEYQQSPSKEYGRTRSRSPEKKKLMM